MQGARLEGVGGVVRLLAYGFSGPLLVAALMAALSGGGQVAVFTDDCRPAFTEEGLVYYAVVPVRAAVPAWVEVEATAFAPPGSVEVEVWGERLTPPLRLNLDPGGAAVITIYCSPEAARMPWAPLAVVEAGVERWFTAATAALAAAALVVVARGV